MTKTLFPGVEEITWREAKKLAVKGDQELFKILEEIDPSDEYTFLRMRYPFGSFIMHEDSVYIPFNGNKSVPLSAPEVPQILKDKLGYRSIPFGMITENPVEVYRETDDRIFSVELSGANKGIEIGIFEFFGLTSCYSVTSGARSLFMIPKISETRHHKKLMTNYHLNCIQPRNIQRHWNVFKELYNSDLFQTKWEAEILYLTKPWDDMLAKSKKSLAWEKLLNYLVKKCNEHSELGRRRLVLDVILWQQISSSLDKQGFKPDNYITDTLKHLIYIFLGNMSGYRPITSDYGGPISEIQKIYAECYGLTQIPTMMGAVRYSLEKNVPVYYSMQTPMMISSSPTIRKGETIIQEMRELMMLKPVLSEHQGNIKINNIKLHDLVRFMKLEYYHGDQYSYGQDIRPTREIPLHDPDFLYMPQNIQKKLTEFADNGSFIRGCIKISKET